MITTAARAGHALAELLILAIRAYQMTLGPLLFRNACRFEPSCSRYMVAALRKYGLVRGFLKGTARFLRCNPCCRGGYDPP